MKVLAISGSLRSGSHNTALLRAAAELAPAGIDVERWDGLRAVPPYDADEDSEPAPAEVARLRDAIAAADVARVVDAELVVPLAHERFSQDGRLVDEDVASGLRDVLETLAAEAAPVAVAA